MPYLEVHAAAQAFFALLLAPFLHVAGFAFTEQQLLVALAVGAGVAVVVSAIAVAGRVEKMAAAAAASISFDCIIVYPVNAC